MGVKAKSGKRAAAKSPRARHGRAVGGEKTGLARYYELYLALSNSLRDGTYAAGDALPSEPDLMRSFRLSRSTVRRALHRLQQEDRIVRRHGSGTYATASPDGERTQFSQSSYIANARALESTTTTRLLQYRHMSTPARLLKLAPDFGPTALHIERARFSRGRPFALLAAYVSPKWSKKLTRAAVGNRATVVALANLGASFSIAHQFYGAMLADQHQAEHLSVDIGTPLLHVISLFREASGHIAHFEEWFLRSDIHSLHSILELA